MTNEQLRESLLRQVKSLDEDLGDAEAVFEKKTRAAMQGNGDAKQVAREYEAEKALITGKQESLRKEIDKI